MRIKAALISYLGLALSSLLATGAGLSTAVAQVQPSGPRLAVISYWDPAEYAKLPSGSLALINPNSGILGTTGDQVERYRGAAADATQRGVKLMAYVRLAYGERVAGKPSAGGTAGRTLATVKAE
jgi:hypothetical protein